MSKMKVGREREKMNFEFSDDEFWYFLSFLRLSMSSTGWFLCCVTRILRFELSYCLWISLNSFFFFLFLTSLAAISVHNLASRIFFQFPPTFLRHEECEKCGKIARIEKWKSEWRTENEYDLILIHHTCCGRK